MVEPMSITLIVIGSLNLLLGLSLSAPTLFRRYSSWSQERSHHSYRVNRFVNAALFYQLVKQIAPQCRGLHHRQILSFGDDKGTYVYAVPGVGRSVVITTRRGIITVTAVEGGTSVDTLELTCDRDKLDIIGPWMKDLSDSMAPVVKEMTI